MQCLKSFLASRLFDGTYVFGWKFTLEDLVALMLADLRAAAIAQLGAGRRRRPHRPPRCTSSSTAAGEVDPERDANALARLTRAAEMAGFRRVEFAYERRSPPPSEYERGLDHDELVLIGDFGGGTSDFLVRLGPRRPPHRRPQARRSSPWTACRSPAMPSTRASCARSCRRPSASAPSAAPRRARSCRSRRGSTAGSSAGRICPSLPCRRRSTRCAASASRRSSQARIANLIHLVQPRSRLLALSGGRARQARPLAGGRRRVSSSTSCRTRWAGGADRAGRTRGVDRRRPDAHRRLRGPAPPALRGFRRRRGGSRLPHRRLVAGTRACARIFADRFGAGRVRGGDELITPSRAGWR